MTQRATRLWVFADSFGVCDPKKDPPRVWTRQLARKLSERTSQPIELFNYSLIGCCQDWTLNSYMSFVDQMLPQDYVVIVLTSSCRYWFFEEIPTLTNWNIIDLDKQVGRERAKAAEFYLKHIQRPGLDHLQSVSRLGLIAYESKRRSLRNPLMIRAFDDSFYPAENWPDLDWAQGFLAEIQFGEYNDQSEVYAMYESNGSGFFKGYDCRYNHMCLSNHDILSDKLAEQIVTGTPADLSKGFQTELITKKWFDDDDFMVRELNPEALKFYFENIHAQGHVLPWKRRVGVEDLMSKFTRTDS